VETWQAVSGRVTQIVTDVCFFSNDDVDDDVTMLLLLLQLLSHVIY